MLAEPPKRFWSSMWIQTSHIAFPGAGRNCPHFKQNGMVGGPEPEEESFILNKMLLMLRGSRGWMMKEVKRLQRFAGDKFV